MLMDTFTTGKQTVQIRLTRINLTSINILSVATISCIHTMLIAETISIKKQV